MAYEFEGVLHEVSEPQQINDRLRKRTFVVCEATNPKYPQYVEFELLNDRCDLLDTFVVGQRVGVEFGLKGRRWERTDGEVRYFNSLLAWELVALSEPARSSGEQQAPPAPETDLPF